MSARNGPVWSDECCAAVGVQVPNLRLRTLGVVGGEGAVFSDSLWLTFVLC